MYHIIIKKLDQEALSMLSSTQLVLHHYHITHQLSTSYEALYIVN